MLPRPRDHRERVYVRVELPYLLLVEEWMVTKRLVAWIVQRHAPGRQVEVGRGGADVDEDRSARHAPDGRSLRHVIPVVNDLIAGARRGAQTRR